MIHLREQLKAKDREIFYLNNVVNVQKDSTANINEAYSTGELRASTHLMTHLMSHLSCMYATECEVTYLLSSSINPHYTPYIPHTPYTEKQQKETSLQSMQLSLAHQSAEIQYWDKRMGILRDLVNKTQHELREPVSPIPAR